MSLLKKLFGKNKQTEKKAPKSEQSNKEELIKKINSIFPYCKQIMESQDSQSETLPNDLAKVDKEKIYTSSKIDFIIRNISGDLNCVYVFDNEFGLEFISKNEISKLNINEDQLHEIAMANLRGLISKRMNAQNNSDAFWFIVDGNFEASLILVDEIWEQVQSHLNEEIVVCVPARDIIFATGVSKSEVIENFSEKAKGILENGDHPLSKNWFIRKDNKWNVYKKIL